jgi:hypothetical protein
VRDCIKETVLDTFFCEKGGGGTGSSKFVTNFQELFRPIGANKGKLMLTLYEGAE